MEVSQPHDAGIRALSEIEIFARVRFGASPNYAVAKTKLQLLHQQNQRTFYCGYQYDDKLEVSWGDCGFTPRLNKSGKLSEYDAGIAARVWWEHVVSAHWIGNARGCWENGKRSGCESSDPIDYAADGDLVNLYPSIGQVNRNRSNYQFGEIWGSPDKCGACQMTVDFMENLAEPPVEKRCFSNLVMCNPIHEDN